MARHATSRAAYSRAGNMRRALGAAVLTTLGAFAAGSVQALTLAEAFEAARSNDPQYRAAYFELEAARQGVPIARGALLPQIGLNLSTADINGTREFPNALNQEVTTRVDYVAPATSLNLRAPLLNFEGLGRLKQARQQVGVAEQTYRAQGLALVDRVGSTYIQALLLRSAVGVSDREIASTESQLARAEQRLLRGEGTRTQVAQARAALETARYRKLDIGDQLNLALVRLRRLTGQDLTWMQELPPDYRPTPMQATSLQEWRDIAVDHNPSIQARREAVQVARTGVQRNLAGHLPRLDLVASMSRNRNESLNTLNQASALRTIGLQLSLPVFSGGAIDASVRQAEAQQGQSEEELRTEREAVEIEIERLYMAVEHGSSRIEAATRVIEANQTALTGVSRALDAGLVTATDVLDAQARLFSSLRDAAQARYDYLVARMRLMAQAGMPMRSIVDDIDRLLALKADLIGDKP
jgi:outer membrane protein, protease secretion system